MLASNKRPHYQTAKKAIREFLSTHAGDNVDFTMEAQTRSYAFWILHDDTTSYAKYDMLSGRVVIEWYGTSWTPSANS